MRRSARPGLLGTAACFAGLACIAADFTPELTDVVIAPDAGEAVRLAADEMTNVLARVFGRTIPVTNAPAEGRRAVVLGDTTWSRAAGVDVSKLPRDAFIMKTAGVCTYIAGRDDTRRDLLGRSFLGSEAPWQPQFERATLFGVYEFLERFAGVRFYFPGDLGTILPHAERIVVPDGSFTVAPDYSVRRYGYGDGQVPAAALESFGGDETAFKRAHFLRTRMETEYIPCCHGLNKFRYLDRFAKTHPEYFSLKENGTRDINAGSMGHVGHVCYSSPITEEIYQDVRAYLTGAPAKTRGLSSWGRNVNGPYVDVMSQDGMGPCHCEKCQARYIRAYGPNYATELIWSNTVAMAQRLKAEGIRGTLTQMAYRPYRRVPQTVDIPDNVAVMVAEGGPWSQGARRAADDAEIRSWTKKLGHKVWLWTYPGKFNAQRFPGIPQMSPRAWGGYFKAQSDAIFGAFAESESDRWMFNHLNYYVFGKTCWNTKTDLDALLEEYYRLMYGPAADEIRVFFEALEEKWCRCVMGRTAETSRGPTVVKPDERTLWDVYYSEKILETWRVLLENAARKTVPGSLESRRVALVREEFLGSLVKARAGYAEKSAKVKLLRAAADGVMSFYLSPMPRKGVLPPEPVKTSVRVARTGRELVIDFDADEPYADDRLFDDVKGDEQKVWSLDGVEIVLNPSADRRTYYHWFVSGKGDVADAKCTRDNQEMKHDFAWSSGAKATGADRAGGWTLHVTIPLAALPGMTDEFTANFCRNRTLRTKPASGWYAWGTYVTGYLDALNYGTLVFPGTAAR